jgi:hypothetical protein
MGDGQRERDIEEGREGADDDRVTRELPWPVPKGTHAGLTTTHDHWQTCTLSCTPTSLAAPYTAHSHRRHSCIPTHSNCLFLRYWDLNSGPGAC